jgi:hypothetical protein
VHEGLGEGDGLQCLRREVYLSRVELTAFAATYDALGVCDCCGPVETLLESAANDGPGGGMMDAGPRMYVSQQFVAAHKFPGRALPIEFLVDEYEGFGSTCDASHPSAVDRELPFHHPPRIGILQSRSARLGSEASPSAMTFRGSNPDGWSSSS